jgi:fructuronate reductase
MTRLSNETLGDLPPSVACPRYDRAGVTPGIVHLGVGAFHRAHQAAMTEAVLNAGARDWGIRAASLRSPETRNALGPQNGLYTLAVRDGGPEQLRVIGSISDVLVSRESPRRLIDAMSAPSTRIVSLTVTEKGYCHDPASGTLDEAHPDVLHDLKAMSAPRSAPGLIIAALLQRRAAGLRPFTVMSCDNLPGNGRVTHRVLSRFAALVDPDLGAFVTNELVCPSGMVDRIVPATTDADRLAVSAALGMTDAWPVMTEPFTQWVIEDRFTQGRPEWELGGAEFVSDVAPFEKMKLRMLNGAHSTFAYLGGLAGHVFVADAANDPLFVSLVERLWAEIIPTLPKGAGLDPAGYAQKLLARFRNPALRHRLAQIAMDGSQKIPQRLVNTIRERRASGAPLLILSLAIAGFLRYMAGKNDGGGTNEINDPLKANFARASEHTDPAEAATQMLALEPVFGDLVRDDVIRNTIVSQYQRLADGGARATIQASLS